MPRPLPLLLSIVALLATGISSASANSAPDPLDVTGSTARVQATAPSSADEPQCTGQRFVTQSDDAKVADQLMKGWLTIPTFPRWKVPNDLTWKENPFKNYNWTFNLHTLRWVDVLRREGIRRNALKPGSGAAMIARYTEVLRDWERDNSPKRTKPTSTYAWYDMAVGVRGIGLVCAATVITPSTTWFKRAVQNHADSLLDPKQYRKIGNHGLHQNMGLLALGCHTNNATWRDTAIQRGRTMLVRSVDSQGVTDEGSILYQRLNYFWYRELDDRITLCNQTPHADYGRIARMPELLAHATQPDGTLVAFGDTSARQRATRVDGTQAEYALSRGACSSGLAGCTRPKNLFQVFKRGYVFSRSGWYDTQTSTRQSLAALRFGSGRAHAVHGHEDAANVSYYARGKQLLWQPGLYGGGGGARRQFVVSNEAHNVVDIPSRRYNSRARTDLSVTRNSPTADLVSVRTKALRGAVWKRTMIHAKTADFMIVDDIVTQPKSATVIQRWQLGADRKVTTGKGRVASSGSGSNLAILYVGEKPSLSVVRGQNKPLLGWRSEKVNSFVKSPTVEARKKGRSVRMTAVLVARPANVAGKDVRVIRTTKKGRVRTVDLAIGPKSYRVKFTSSSAVVRELKR